MFVGKCLRGTIYNVNVQISLIYLLAPVSKAQYFNLHFHRNNNYTNEYDKCELLLLAPNKKH